MQSRDDELKRLAAFGIDVYVPFSRQGGDVGGTRQLGGKPFRREDLYDERLNRYAPK